MVSRALNRGNLNRLLQTRSCKLPMSGKTTKEYHVIEGELIIGNVCLISIIQARSKMRGKNHGNEAIRKGMRLVMRKDEQLSERTNGMGLIIENTDKLSKAPLMID